MPTPGRARLAARGALSRKDRPPTGPPRPGPPDRTQRERPVTVDKTRKKKAEASKGAKPASDYKSREAAGKVSPADAAFQ